MGLEIKLESVENTDVASEIDIQKILIQIMELAVAAAQSAEDFVKCVILTQIVKIKDYNTGVTVNLSGINLPDNIVLIFAGISAAVRYLHSPASVASIADFESILELAKHFVDAIAEL